MGGGGTVSRIKPNAKPGGIGERLNKLYNSGIDAYIIMYTARHNFMDTDGRRSL